MQHLRELAEATPDRPTCLTIGGFDGVHRGHQQVVSRLIGTATEQGFRSAVLTFCPLPRQVLDKAEPRYYLTSPQERARLLHQMGVELVITQPFDEQVRRTAASDFVDSLVVHLRIKELWVGPDFALGFKREGDVAFLRAQGAAKGFVVHTVDFYRAETGNPSAVENQVVSSSLIRRMLREGRIREANDLLGRPYRLPGRVVRGDQRGRLFGFPTANLAIWHEQVFPARGVYAGRAWVDEQSLPAAINVGVRPTVTAGEDLTVEAHLAGFSGDLYGRKVALDFLAPIRPEIKFASVDQLVAQLGRDVAETRRVVEENGGR